MGSTTADVEFCEHDEVQAACLECLAMPKKVVLKPSSTPRATKNPSSPTDKISPLAGDLDMSMPVVDVDSVVGLAHLSTRVFPHYLRRGGWIYLRSNDKLQARVKALKVVWQDDRSDLADPNRHLGDGIAIKVDPETWSAVDIPLGQLAERQQDGFRYLMTDPDDSVTHYMGGRPVPSESGIDLR